MGNIIKENGIIMKDGDKENIIGDLIIIILVNGLKILERDLVNIMKMVINILVHGLVTKNMDKEPKYIHYIHMKDNG